MSASPAAARRRFLPLVLAAAGLDLGLEQFMIVPILPAVQEQYSASLATTAWLVTGFLLASVATVPLLGRLGDLYGKRRIVLIALVAFGAGSLVCALADSVELLIAGRVVQGAGAALGPLGIGLARDHTAPDRVAARVGVLVAGAGAGIAVGLVLGGVLVDVASVSAVFWCLFGLAGALLIAIWYVVPETPVRATGRVDWAGALLLSGGLVAAALAISKGNDWGWGSWEIVGLFGASAVLLVCFAFAERSVPAPLIDAALMRRRPVWSANVVAFALGFALLLAAVVVPQLGALPRESGYGLGLTATQIGLVLLPSGLAIVVGGWASGVLVSRTGARFLAAAGAVLASGAYALLVVWHESVGWVAAASALLGIGIGVGFAAAVNLVVHAVDEARTGIFASTVSISRVTGAALGGQIAAAVVVGAGVTQQGFPAESGFTGAFTLGLVAALGALLATATIPRRSVDPSAGAVLPGAERARALP
jgi:MFS family permease